jgi:hypothetical protein
VTNVRVADTSYFLGDEARREYYSLLAGLSRQYPRFVSSLQYQHGLRADQGRAAVVEFKEGQQAEVETFDNPEQLRDHLDAYELPKHCSSSEPGACRRLWLLEDTSINWITVLGSRLRIPPCFFASQWADPTGSDFNERHSFASNPRRRFLLKYPRFHRLDMRGITEDLREPVVLMDSHVERFLFTSGKEDVTGENPDFARTYHNVSFWSRELSGSWDGKHIPGSGQPQQTQRCVTV